MQAQHVCRYKPTRYNQQQVIAVTQPNIATMQDILDALDRNPDLQRL